MSDDLPAAEREAWVVRCGCTASGLPLPPRAGLVAAFDDRVVTALADVLFLTAADEGSLFLDAELDVFEVAATA